MTISLKSSESDFYSSKNKTLCSKATYLQMQKTFSATTLTASKMKFFPKCWKKLAPGQRKFKFKLGICLICS